MTELDEALQLCRHLIRSVEILASHNEEMTEQLNTHCRLLGVEEVSDSGLALSTTTLTNRARKIVLELEEECV